MRTIPVSFAPDDDIIDICYDKVFKAVFTKPTPESEGALKLMLSAFIGREVSQVAVTMNEPPIDDLRDRQIRYDVNCRFNDGELADVEMTLYPTAAEPARLEYYASWLHTGQDIQSAVEMDSMERWAVFFKFCSDNTKRGMINEILAREEGISMAGQVMLTISKDEHEYARKMTLEKSILDTKSHLLQAKREGEKRGIQIGETRGIQIGEKRGVKIGKSEVLDLLRSGKSPEEILRLYDIDK